ncbi:MAG: hypothetical protein ND895_01580 [Pyrinomonadaceae bacterium]|nr:hypothetical protein [Pyrinomonadaceae bacterium]
MINRKFIFFAMLALIFGMATFGLQQTTGAKAAPITDDNHHGDNDHDNNDDDHAVRILVDNDRVQCPNAQYTSIQAAVDAAPPGAVISVCPGTYAEEVRINKRLTIRGIRVGNESLAVIMPPIAVANTSSFGGSPIAAIVLVEKTSGVTLDNLAVDGASNLIAGCAPNIVGIYYRNASGKVVNSVVRNIRLFPDALLGCQSGLAIYAQAGNEPGVTRRARLEVLNSSVHDYQKNGVTADAAGTELTAVGNAVTGLGPTPAIAQNGFQVSRGAKGLLESNLIVNHIYSLCLTAANCGAVSTNILTFQTSFVSILKNNLAKSQVNVYLEGSRNEVIGNTIFDTDVFDGVFILGDSNRVSSNSIFNSDEAAVWISGNNNRVNDNTFNEAPIGVFHDGTGNNVNGNRYYNIAERTQSPSSTATSFSMRSSGDVSGRATISPAQP